MTVSSQNSRIEQLGDGTTTAFAVNFYFLENSDLKVFVNGVLQTITTNYTVTGAGNPAGGTVTFVSAPANGVEVVIFRDPAITQGLDYIDNDPFPAESHERGLDKLTMIAQRAKDLVSRALRLGDSVVGVSTELPALSGGQLLGTNPGGTGFQLYPLGSTPQDAGSTVYSPNGVGAVSTSVEDILDAQLMVDYVALRAYTGLAKTVRITGLLTTAQPQGIAGFFQYDETDATSADNGGTIIVGSDGRRWKRVYSGAVKAAWFGAVAGQDNTTEIQAMLNSGLTGEFELVDSTISSIISMRSNQHLRGGKLTAAVGYFGNGIRLYEITNASVKNVEITGNFDFAIRVAKSTNIEICDNYVHDIGQNSPEFGFGIVVGDFAVAGDFSQNILIDGNTVKNILGNGDGRGDGVLLLRCSDVRVTNNYIDTVNRMGVAVTTGCHDVIIDSNNILNVALAGVDIETDIVQEPSYNIDITNNSIVNYGRSGFTGVGTQKIAVDVHDAAYNVNVANNVITPGAGALYVFLCINAAFNVNFIGNIVNAGGNPELFLKNNAGSGTDKINVIGNICTFGNVGSFCDLFDGASINIKDNIFAGSGAALSYFVKLVDVSDLVCSNNKCSAVENFTTSGIGTCNNLVFSNNISDTLGHGISLRASSVGIRNVVIEGNVLNTPAGFNGINIDFTSGVLERFTFNDNIIPTSTTKIVAASALTGYSRFTVSDRSVIGAPVAGQVVFELSTNETIQYLSGAWAAPT